MAALKISSLQNPKIKALLQLRKKKERDQTNLFLIEGYREISRALESQDIWQIFVCSSFFKENQERRKLVEQLKKRFAVFECSEAVFKKISYREHPDGLLIVAKKQIKQLKDLAKGRLFILLEGVEKPGNLGTIFRSCDSFGVDAILITDPSCDVFNPNVIRASMGAFFTVPWAQCTNEEANHWLREQKLQLIATTPSASVNIHEVNLKKATCLVFGSEKDGLSAFWLGQNITSAKVPMVGSADSLNLAICCVVCLYEAKRQSFG